MKTPAVLVFAMLAISSAHASNNPVCSNSSYMNGGNSKGCMELDISEDIRCGHSYNLSELTKSRRIEWSALRSGCSRITRERYQNSWHMIHEGRLDTVRHNPGDIRFLTYHHQGSGAKGGDGTALSVVSGIHRHHTSGECHNSGCAHKWGDIAYHYIVDRFGNIFEARSLHFAPNSGGPGRGSAGSTGNHHYPGHFAVVFAGDLDNEAPQPAAMLSVARVLSAAQLRFELGSEAIKPHNHHSPYGFAHLGWGTDCPGSYFTPERHEELVALTTSISIQKILTDRNCKPGPVDGDIGPNTKAAIDRLEAVVGVLPSEPRRLLEVLMMREGRCSD